MDIKQQALETARQFAYDFNDLMAKTREIEAYLLGTTSLTPPSPIVGDIIDVATNAPVDCANQQPRPNPFDHESLNDTTEFLSATNGMAGDLTALGYNDPLIKINGVVISLGMSGATEKMLTSDIPIPPYPDTDTEFAMDNFTVEVRETPHGIPRRANLRQKQLGIGQYMASDNMVVSVCRQFGTTTMIAAFARQQRMRGKKILVLTNTHRNVAALTELIDDTSIGVYSFADIEAREWAGERYDHIVVDNAAFIPYSYEDKISKYINDCRNADTKVALLSVPGQEAGWFYDMWIDQNNESVRKLAIDWKLSAILTEEKAAELRCALGEAIFSNQFENKFRPVTA